MLSNGQVNTLLRVQAGFKVSSDATTTLEKLGYVAPICVVFGEEEYVITNQGRKALTAARMMQ